MKNVVFTLTPGLLLGQSGCFLQPAPQQTKGTPSPLESQALSSNILADFEGTAPSGFFVFNGASSVSTTPITAAAGGPLALPSQAGDNGVLETTFSDDVSGWQKVSLPFSQFVRSAHQPTGAPHDGLNLRSVWGYGFTVNDDATYYLDQISVQ